MTKFLHDLLSRLPELEFLTEELNHAFDIMREVYEHDGTMFVCGNGGSAADSEHIVGELMKGFILKRPLSPEFRSQLMSLYGEDGRELANNLQQGLRAVALTSHPALNTAFANDVDATMIFAQQLFVLGRPGDALMVLTTSGNSVNVIKAVQVAKARGLRTIAMTGASGGRCRGLVDCLINAPHRETFRVQEYHLPIYHALCLMVEDYFYGC
ncbi:MAG: SIS domain-containing protein [Victivallales bacterium]|nr:SIS domain-containing protein [Victivallales bacterium]